MRSSVERIAPWVGDGGTLLATATALGVVSRSVAPLAITLTWLLAAFAFIWTGLGRPPARTALAAAALAGAGVALVARIGVSLPAAAHASAYATARFVDALALAAGLLTMALSLVAIGFGYWLAVSGLLRRAPRDETEAEGRPGLWSAVGVAARWWVGVEWVGLAAAAWAGGRSASLAAAVQRPVGWVLIQTATVLALATAGWYGFQATPRGIPRRVTDLHPQAAAVGLGVGVIGGVALLGLSAATASQAPFRGLLALLVPTMPHGPWAVSWLLGGALLPLAQEWAFRGFLQTVLGLRVKPRVAAVVAAAIFALTVSGPALTHAWSVFVVAVAMGYGLGELRRASGSLTAPAVAHAAANTVVLVTVGLAATRPG